MPTGSDIFESQSKTVSLLHPSVPQVPLFLQPFGSPDVPEAQLVQPIFILYKALFQLKRDED